MYVGMYVCVYVCMCVWVYVCMCVWYLHIILVLPHWHGDRVVEDERPDHTQDQLQVPIHDRLGVWTQVRGQPTFP